MKIFQKTDIGMVRKMNQDACQAGEFPDGMAWAVVCDGMGGAASGDVASTTAVRIISERIHASYREGMQANSIRSLLFSAIEAANAVVYEMSCSNPAFEGMGTTVVAAVVRDSAVYVAHAGDSRAYRITGENIFQLTRDHSMVQAMVDRGQITASEAKDHPRKNIITRALGVDKNILIDFCEEPFEPGDTLLICTDGLTNTVDDLDILRTLHEQSADVSEQLIRLANAHGGQDNITVVAISN
ncbi:MAG: Stp1/IreP family PP2C-type Ser/Thr phosphatase [Oscillospiraceae bacterium]|nr:Stp1/IreP family PP2C-type Ser/Thr phosphatase [Oscillospiraceae bacterium]